MPRTGEAGAAGERFLLTGQSPSLRSHTERRLVGGAVKGFTLVWRPNATSQIAACCQMMQQSFTALDGTLDPGAIPDGLEEDVT